MGNRVPASLTTGTAAAGLLCALFFLSCASPGARKTVQGSLTCTGLDSLYRASGFEAAVSIVGRATFDVEQYRIRGQFNLITSPNGEVAFEFSSSTLFGSRREEISLSIADGVIRVLDRERGRYYEGEEVDFLIQDVFEANIDTKQFILLLLGTVPPCDEFKKAQITASANGDTVVSGRLMGHPLRIVFGAQGRKLKALHWPVRFEDSGMDQLTADYSWKRTSGGGAELRKLVITVEKRGWRIKFAASS